MDKSQRASIEDIYLSIEVEDNSIEKVFKEIRRQTGFEFVYDKKDLNKEKLSIDQHNKSLAYILKDVSQKNTPGISQEE